VAIRKDVLVVMRFQYNAAEGVWGNGKSFVGRYVRVVSASLSSCASSWLSGSRKGTRLSELFASTSRIICSMKTSRSSGEHHDEFVAAEPRDQHP
jgi:hypothetical protein